MNGVDSKIWTAAGVIKLRRPVEAGWGFAEIVDRDVDVADKIEAHEVDAGLHGKVLFEVQSRRRGVGHATGQT